ncbi:threonine aldolase family protein [Paralimibaculum aggregatum]|uniref:Threonine aldolase family protein n=1 Tax=Paralimibaculum aggregatum TaxID=3036245 RepID=A0ABQ6LS04_9RHOB|nr:threonine aldolase family protein [Limibaculum sp. NKW23]GMG84614.1 threonine aldolase family protein [Limibaculum sp. NKW23]
MQIRHNFYSDTQTRPPRAMLETALTAETGDEQGMLDPTTRALEERVAELLGMEAAVFLPSGSMCNEIAVAVHCRPGDEVICHRVCHLIEAEGGGPAALSGVMMHPLDSPDGQFGAAEVTAAIREPSRYSPRSRLVAVEQTCNLAGGTVWPVERLLETGRAARAAGLAVHMDGARLMNAVVASGRPAAAHTMECDSAWIDLTKGLGCPVGAVLAGSRGFIEEAWRFKQRWGGAMRQSGVLAAMGLYALDHHVERLADDHALAAGIADRLGRFDLVTDILPVTTNIVIFDLHPAGPDAETAAARLLQDGVRVSVFGPRRLRVVTHLDVGAADAEALIAAFARLD